AAISLRDSIVRRVDVLACQQGHQATEARHRLVADREGRLLQREGTVGVLLRVLGIAAGETLVVEGGADKTSRRKAGPRQQVRDRRQGRLRRGGGRRIIC